MTDRIRFDHRAIRASAGTGKTYALTSRYIGLLAAGVSPANIVATTFSRKAAGEIHERVLRRLSAAVHDDDDRAELNKAIERDLSAADHAALLVQFVQQTHRVNIATLDAIFIRIASAFGLELHLPPGWTIGRTIDDAAVREDAIAAMLEASPVDRLIGLLRLLNEGDDRASVTRRVDEAVQQMHKLYLDAPLASQWNWLEKPAVPDSAALDSIIERISDMPIPTTQAGKPRKHWLNNREQITKALLAGDWKTLIGISLVGRIIAGEPEFDRATIDDDAVAAISPAISIARIMLIRNLAGQNEATHALLRDFDEHHLALRRRRRLLTFDEVTRTLVAGRLTGHLDRIYYRLDGRIHHLLLDEFQDTSLPQWRVIQPIARELTDTDPDEGRTAFVVGDTKQAIYGWREGNAEIFRGISDELPGIGSPEPLAKSWRSSQVVIDLVNRVFTKLIENKALADRTELARSWADDFQSHSTHRTELEGYADLCVADDPPAAATQRVLEERQRRPHATIVVLTRSNKIVGDIIFRLRRAGVLASEEGGNPLTDSPAVSVVLSLLTLADHPGDSAARFHVQQSPLGPLVGLTERTHAGTFAAELRRRLADSGYGRAVYDWVKAFASHCDQRNVNRLMQLVELADQFDARPTVRTRDFVRLVHETRVEDPSSASVRVMTIHQSKGLEFDVVILPELEGELLGKQPPQAISDRPTPTSDIDPGQPMPQ
jgi:ATP-dependent helicase/nuclease subunit A